MATKQDLISAVDHYLRKTTLKPDPVPAQLDRIKTLTQTARTTWFGYLGALAFSFITLAGIGPADFFTSGASTQLPIVNIAVPVRTFMWAGALLVATVYIYMHVFLEQLWNDLGGIDATRGDDKTPIAVFIHPWLITEFGLNVRKILRPKEDPCVGNSWLGILGVVASALLGWLAGPALLCLFWIKSMPAREFSLTALIGIFFWATMLTMVLSLRSMWLKLKTQTS